jgi:hypothetical protein
VGLPDLGGTVTKAKVDTGARSSALHAFDLHRFQRNGIERVRFDVHPIQRKTRPCITVEAVVADERRVTSSSGKSQLRPVIITSIELGDERWSIELTLTRRDEMGFRMLLGRQAIRGRYVVDPGRSYLQSPKRGAR